MDQELKLWLLSNQIIRPEECFQRDASKCASNGHTRKEFISSVMKFMQFLSSKVIRWFQWQESGMSISNKTSMMHKWCISWKIIATSQVAWPRTLDSVDSELVFATPTMKKLELLSPESLDTCFKHPLILNTCWAKFSLMKNGLITLSKRSDVDWLKLTSQSLVLSKLLMFQSLRVKVLSCSGLTSGSSYLRIASVAKTSFGRKCSPNANGWSLEDSSIFALSQVGSVSCSPVRNGYQRIRSPLPLMHLKKD